MYVRVGVFVSGATVDWEINIYSMKIEHSKWFVRIDLYPMYAWRQKLDLLFTAEIFYRRKYDMCLYACVCSGRYTLCVHNYIREPLGSM